MQYCNRVCIWKFLVRYIVKGCIFCAPSGLRKGQVLTPPPPSGTQLRGECPLPPGPVHHPRQSLSEKHPKRGWSDGAHCDSSLNTTPRAHRGIAPRFPTLSADRPRTYPGYLWIWYPFYSYFPVFDTLTRYVPGGEKIPFLRVFIDSDDVQAPMRHAPPPPPGLSPNSFTKLSYPRCCVISIQDTYYIIFVTWLYAIIGRKRRANCPKYSPQILVGMCRGKVKNWQGLRNEFPGRAWKWGSPGSVLAWKWDSPALPGRVWLTRDAENGTLRNCQDASG